MAIGWDLGGLPRSPGGGENALRRLVARAPVRGSPVSTAAEPSARVAGRTPWPWGLQTPAASYPLLVPSRGGELIAAFVAGGAPAGWDADRGPPQRLPSAGAPQLCRRHQARDRRSRAVRTPVTGAGAAATGAARPQQRSRLHRDSRSGFVHRDAVEPTTSSSARDRRPAGRHRTVSGSFPSAWGADAAASRTTSLSTARKQGRTRLDAFPTIAAPSPLQALPARS